MDSYVIKNQKKLKCGITTGTCAAAAAKAAAAFLLLHQNQERVKIYTPKGVTAEVAVFPKIRNQSMAEYAVIKDSGDDPDVTNHAEILAKIEILGEEHNVQTTAFTDDRFPDIFLDGGAGIGRVTKSGLEQHIGQAAINIVPRKMIFEVVGEIAELAEYHGRLMITISIPNGCELAKKTFNPRLGIVGGLSILGTSGILEPMSEKAIVDTIETQIRQLKAQGETCLLVMPGNYGQTYASEYLHLELEDSIKCSNYIGETIDLAISYGMETFLLVGNIGKLVKLAAGIMNTHSKVADARNEIFAVHAVLCGGDKNLAGQLMDCINTEEMLEILENHELRTKVLDSICAKIQEHLEHRTGGKLEFGVVLFSEHFGYLGETKQAAECLNELRMKRRLDKI